MHTRHRRRTSRGRFLILAAGILALCFVATILFIEVEHRKVSREVEAQRTITAVQASIQEAMDYYNDGPTVLISDLDGDGQFSLHCDMATYINDDSVGSYVRAFSRVASEQCSAQDIPISEYQLSMVQDGDTIKSATWTSPDGLRGDFVFSSPDRGWVHIENASPEDIEAQLGSDTFGYDFGLK